MFAFQLASLGLFFLLLLLAGLRLKKTPASHSDYQARRNTVRLLGVLVGGLGLSVLRTQFVPVSWEFVTLSILLVPIGILALGLIWRLFVAYRLSRVLPPDNSLPDITTLQTRITPPDNGKSSQ